MGKRAKLLELQHRWPLSGNLVAPEEVSYQKTLRRDLLIEDAAQNRCRGENTESYFEHESRESPESGLGCSRLAL